MGLLGATLIWLGWAVIMLGALIMLAGYAFLAIARGGLW